MDLSPLELIREDLKTVDARMRDFSFPSSAPVVDSVERLLAAGGKRLRPALALLFGRMLRVAEEPLFRFSASVEVIHTATLIHDDLVDHSSIRRGVPTVNAKWSAGTAVLVGDFLFAWAARLTAATGSTAVVERFAETLSTIVDGEIRQLSAGDACCGLVEYENRIRSKTAALFEVSCTGPALLAGDAATADRAARYGNSFGMAFQIADDILDFIGDSASTGKPSGQDLAHGLLTLPAILYLESHPGDPDAAAFLAGKRAPEILGPLFEKVRSSDAIEQSRESARRHIGHAVESLAGFPPGAHRDALETLVRSIV
ncbi:MAG: polyprenyl synthetase family protein [Anaerolineales bacterium]